MQIQAVTWMQLIQTDWFIRRRALKKLNSSEISTYCENMAILLSSGISVEEAVEIVYAEESNELAKAVNDNFELTLSDAMNRTEMFPNYTIDMIETGEATGKTEEMLFGLANYYENVDSHEKNISDLILYPSIIMVLISGIMLFIVLKILPIFKEVYENLAGYMDINTTTYFNLAAVLGWLVFVVSLGTSILILLTWNNWKRKRALNKTIFLFRKFTKSEKAIIETELAKFTDVLAIYVESGIDIITAVENASKFITHEKLKKALNNCEEKVSQGVRLSQAMKEENIYTPLNRRLLFTAESSGKLTKGLKELSKKQWQTADETLRQVTETIEPTVSLVITVFIGLLLISVMLPLISIMASIG